MKTYTPGIGEKRKVNIVTEEKENTANALRAVLPYLSILLAYVGVEFLPWHMDVIDNVGVHWLYLALVNGIATGFLIARKEFVLSAFRNRLATVYFAFCACCAISVFAAFNKVEWLVAFSRVLITAGMFVNCAIILNMHRQLYRTIMLLLVASGAVQAAIVTFGLLSGDAVDSITLGLGNKNILAATLMVKLALGIFTFNSLKGLPRVLSGAAVVLMMIAIYGLSSRSSIAGMAATMLLYVIAAIATRKQHRSLIPMAVMVIVFSCVTLLMQFWSGTASNAYKGATIVQRVASVKEEAAGQKEFSRATFWRFAGRYIADHPLAGGGLGNWKINAVPYEKQLLFNNYHSIHAHNDLLEVAADTGIPGALVYFSIFVVCGWVAVRIIMKGKGGDDVLLFLAPFAGIAAYLCDATFNFPLERANMQVLFAVSLALACTSYNRFFPKADTDARRSPLNPAHLAILLVAVSTLFISWKSFRSMQGQFITREDMAGTKPPTHSFDEIEPYFGSIPNIAENGVPLADIKAKYLLDENRYDEALQMIVADGNSNPYMPFRHMIFGTVYRKKNDLDSAYRHFSIAWEYAPLVYTYYAEVQKICAIRKDSVALKRNFAQISRHPQEAQAWIDMAHWTMNVNGNNIDGATVYLEEGKKRFPDNKAVPFNLHSITAFYHTRKEDYKSAIDEGVKALQFGETYVAVENLALSYFGNRQYDKALVYFDMAIKKFGHGNGESVYFRGQCYYIGNDHAHACADFRTARDLKYPVETSLLELCK